MKYSKPEVRLVASALAAVQSQTVDSKGVEFTDRLDLQPSGQYNSIADPAAYEADE